MDSVNIISSTPNAEHIMGYCARASSPKNQELMRKGQLTAAGLLKYCAQHGHWSVFEMANVVVEIHTTRAISAQILRHRSFSFQEFSQRYAKVDISYFPMPEMRKAGAKNRQSSSEMYEYFDDEIEECLDWVLDLYSRMVSDGVATETARMILPMCTPTRLYMSGTVRSWIHYLEVRCKPDVQKEHRLIALEIREKLTDLLPVCAEAFDWRSTCR